jgi:hypothetical protein
MVFDKHYPNRKDHRAPSRHVSSSCRPNGGCPWCERGRMRQTLMADEDAQLGLLEHVEPEETHACYELGDDDRFRRVHRPGPRSACFTCDADGVPESDLSEYRDNPTCSCEVCIIMRGLPPLRVPLLEALR